MKRMSWVQVPGRDARSCVSAIVILLGLVLVWVAQVCAQEAAQAVVPDQYDVRQFGAVGDGKTDGTAAFQKALDAAGKAGGGIVYAPRGNYLFAGHLNVPNAVTLAGMWQSVPAHNGIRDRGMPKPTDDGTTFLVTEGAGSEDGPAFVTLNTDSTLRGVVLYYPQQNASEEPKPYPWAIAMRGKNPAVLAVEMLNPYNGIDATHNERHLIRDVQGQPIRRGILVDDIYDIGRIENVHFNPWWSTSPKLFQWQMNNGEAFIFARSDWQYVFNTFCFGYKIGYKFIKSNRGVCNGNFLGIGADDCQTALVVEESAPFGLLITNGEFVSFHGPDPTMIEVTQTNKGSIRFVNCAYWGPCNQIARIAGTGTVGFSDCTFTQWGGKEGNRPAIQAQSGTILVRGCEFRQDRPQIQLGEDVRRAIIAENIFTGSERIDNRSKGNVQIGQNVADKPAEVSGTFSIVAVDPNTGVCGAAVASKYPAVGKVVPYVRAGVGAFCTQHWHNPPWGEQALDLLAKGELPEQVLAELLRDDPQRDKRQLAIIDMTGRAANRNPADADPSGIWWGAASGRYYACQGNTLAGQKVIFAMARAYEETKGSLADRLMAALVAGDAAGGDHRGRLAAGIRVAKVGIEGYWLELCVDKSDDAVTELAKKYAELEHEAKQSSK